MLTDLEISAIRYTSKTYAIVYLLDTDSVGEVLGGAIRTINISRSNRLIHFTKKKFFLEILHVICNILVYRMINV